MLHFDLQLVSELGGRVGGTFVSKVQPHISSVLTLATKNTTWLPSNKQTDILGLVLTLCPSFKMFMKNTVRLKCKDIKTT